MRHLRRPLRLAGATRRPVGLSRAAPFRSTESVGVRKIRRLWTTRQRLFALRQPPTYDIALSGSASFTAAGHVRYFPCNRLDFGIGASVPVVTTHKQHTGLSDSNEELISTQKSKE